MKLTNYHRDAFIKAAMDDVPSVDYDAQAQKLVREHITTLMPKELRDALKKAPAIIDWLNNAYVYMPGCLSNFYTPGMADINQKAKDDPRIKDKLDALESLKREQSKQYGDLEAKLRGVAYACTTLKALKEALPEFEKYMPEEQQTTRNLPAVANVVADFVKAGWPKSNTNAQPKAQA